MAFYAIRLNDIDEEQSLRPFGNTTQNLMLGPSDNFSVAHNTHRSQASTYRTVRYVNSATFIEKDCPTVPPQSNIYLPEEDEEEDDDSDVVNGVLVENERIDTGSITSSKSNNSLPYKSLEYPVVRNNTVPQLEITSNEDSFPSSNNITYSYRKIKEGSERSKRRDAFKEWLDAKQLSEKYKKDMQKKKLDEEARKREEEEKSRREEAERKFNEWCRRKGNTTAKKSSTNLDDLKQQQNNNKQISEEDIRSNYKAWLEKKYRQEKISKEQMYDDLKCREKYKSFRETAAKLAYEKWLKEAPSKPKPVPLNKGFLTLKGSISKMFVNPNPWISDIGTAANTKTL